DFYFFFICFRTLHINFFILVLCLIRFLNSFCWLLTLYPFFQLLVLFLVLLFKSLSCIFYFLSNRFFRLLIRFLRLLHFLLKDILNGFLSLLCALIGFTSLIRICTSLRLRKEINNCYNNNYYNKKVFNDYTEEPIHILASFILQIIFRYRFCGHNLF